MLMHKTLRWEHRSTSTLFWNAFRLYGCVDVGFSLGHMHTLACCHFSGQRNHACLLQYTPDVPYHEMVEDVAPKFHFDYRVMDVSYFFPLGLRFLHFSNVSVHLDQLKPTQTQYLFRLSELT